MSVISIFNNLKGTQKRFELRKLVNLARKDGANEVVDKLTTILRNYPDKKVFKLNVKNKVTSAETSMLNGLDTFCDVDESLEGVSPDEIYDMVTDALIKLIEEDKDNKLVWQKPVKSMDIYGMAASNFDSKKAYSGINSFLLNLLWPMVYGKNWDLPYFLTFKQVTKFKGKVKKGAKAYKVIYYSISYSVLLSNGKKFSTTDKKRFEDFVRKNVSLIPTISNNPDNKVIENFVYRSGYSIVKYYNVFNADDITGIDWKLKPQKPKTEVKRIESAERIVSNMPLLPKITNKGVQPMYIPARDLVDIPKIKDFKTPQEYYGTLFHELVHSTLHKKRLDRDASNYPLEELVAELGASFLNAESGILYFNIKNSAAYLKGWRKRLLKELKEDNRFFFHATSRAQKAADYILDRDSKGIPKYLTAAKPKVVKTVRKKAIKKTVKVPGTKKPKVNAKTGQVSLFGTDKKTSKKGLGSVFGDNDLFQIASDKSVKENRPDTFRLKGEIGKLMEDLQRFRMSIVLTGDPHAGKSEFAKQLVNAFIESGFKVGFFDLEQGGMQSKDTEESINRNIPLKNQSCLAVAGEAPNGIDTIKQYADKFDVVVIDSFQKLNIHAKRFDELRLEYPNTIWIVIFQQNAEGGTSGGSASTYDTPIKIKVHRSDHTFVNNYAEIEKNRGNSIGQKYNIFQRKVLPPEEDNPKKEEDNS